MNELILKYPLICQMLRTLFNAQDGLPEDVSIRLYVSSASSEAIADVLKRELEAAFSDRALSWVNLLSNDAFEVYCAEDEQDARQYAKRILWLPILGTGSHEA